MKNSKTLNWLVDSIGNKERLLDRLLTKKNATKISRILHTYTKPLNKDAGYNYTWGEIRRNEFAFVIAAENGNVLKALNHRDSIAKTNGASWGERWLAQVIVLADEIDGMKEVVGWILNFQKETADCGPTEFTHRLICLGVEDPFKCNCLTGEGEADENFPWAIWLHNNHKLINRAAWEIMNSSGMVQKVRRVLNNDAKKAETEIVSSKFRKTLMNNFITANPADTWVG